MVNWMNVKVKIVINCILEDAVKGLLCRYNHNGCNFNDNENGICHRQIN